MQTYPLDMLCNLALKCFLKLINIYASSDKHVLNNLIHMLPVTILRG